MDRGWIKLWRKSIDSAVFQNDGLWKCWTWCLMKATHQEINIPVSTGRGKTIVHLKPGQFIFGRKSAAKELGMPQSTVRNRFAKLVSLQMLTESPLAGFTQNQDRQKDRHFTVYSLINWETYHGSEEKENKQEDRQRTGKGHKQEHKEVYIGKFFSVTESQHQKYEEAYPNLNLIDEYKKMEAWLESNPSKRKTKRGYPRFVNNWLSKAYEAQKDNQGNWFDKYPEL